MTVAATRFIKVSVLALAAALSVPGPARAHGEQDPGPNGGEIRMPGAFHVEAVVGNDALLVYLLDMKFQNPRVAGSSVTASLRQNDETRQLECRAVETDQRFKCPLPAGADLDSGELTINASRGDVPGTSVQYELPLIQGGGTES
ncbi:MAG TPA: hypothetical protein VK973_14160 [Arenicellales bacterium]|nr:hypothetical protein [Arenicellales bacterium]